MCHPAHRAKAAPGRDFSLAELLLSAVNSLPTPVRHRPTRSYRTGDRLSVIRVSGRSAGRLCKAEAMTPHFESG